MLTEDKLKRLMSTRFALIYHPDKNVNEPRQIQILRAEIMKLINVFVEEYKWRKKIKKVVSSFSFKDL